MPAIAACTDTGDSGAADRGLRTRGVESLRSISGDQCRQAPQVGGLSGMAATWSVHCIGLHWHTRTDARQFIAPTSVSESHRRALADRTDERQYDRTDSFQISSLPVLSPKLS
jgi:hypothetical protein